MDEGHKKYLKFEKRLLMVGFGSIGQASLPLILRHLDIKPSQITIITKRDDGSEIAKKYGVNFIVKAITKQNYQTILNDLIGEGDFLLNLSVDVSSLELLKFARQKGTLYLDTCIEPWEGGYFDGSVPSALRSNYVLRESVLAIKNSNEKHSTAVITHGANPGLVSHFVKQALLNIAKDTGIKSDLPKTKQQWAELAKELGIKAIHIAERDTQISNKPKLPDEFVNTWSVDGFVGEGSQPAELGWGSHEKHWPIDGHKHNFGCKSSIYLDRPGASTRVRTWTPLSGPFHGFLITHGESISISHFFTLEDNDTVVYRPTVHYAYHPCEAAVLSLHELAGREWQQQAVQRLILDEVVDGIDELGVLLMGHAKGAYWFGSQLSIHEARKLVPYNNATSLQVAMGVLSGLIWAMEHPNRGIVEPDEIDFNYIMEIARPYLGKVCGHYTDWTPLQDRERLFPETMDKSDPWQFINMRVY